MQVQKASFTEAMIPLSEKLDFITEMMMVQMCNIQVFQDIPESVLRFVTIYCICNMIVRRIPIFNKKKQICRHEIQYCFY